jgi:hypothetical protein
MYCLHKVLQNKPRVARSRTSHKLALVISAHNGEERSQ